MPQRHQGACPEAAPAGGRGRFRTCTPLWRTLTSRTSCATWRREDRSCTQRRTCSRSSPGRYTSCTRLFACALKSGFRNRHGRDDASASMPSSAVQREPSPSRSSTSLMLSGSRAMMRSSSSRGRALQRPRVEKLDLVRGPGLHTHPDQLGSGVLDGPSGICRDPACGDDAAPPQLALVAREVDVRAVIGVRSTGATVPATSCARVAIRSTPAEGDMRGQLRGRAVTRQRAALGQ